MERLWSILRILLGTQRQRLSRKHLQMLASLKENFDLWADDERACCAALLDASGDKEDTVEDEGKEVDDTTKRSRKMNSKMKPWYYIMPCSLMRQ